jgi:hypothetical protein
MSKDSLPLLVPPEELGPPPKPNLRELSKTFKNNLLRWLSESSGEKVADWNRVSRGDVICFVINRLCAGTIPTQNITDGVDRFARVGNWREVMKGMRKLGMNWNYDHVKLVGAERSELEKLVRAMRRWEVRNLEELLEPPAPDEWNDKDIPVWFTQQTAKELEEERLAMGESTQKKWMVQAPVKLDPRKLKKLSRVSIRDQMAGKFVSPMVKKKDEKRSSL